MLITHFRSLTSKIIKHPLNYNLSQTNRKQHFFNIKDQSPSQVPATYPKQYPTNLVDAGPMIHRGRPVQFITPKGEIAEEKMMSNDDVVVRKLYNDQWKSPQNAYRLKVGLIGPVNSGKSELLSRLGHKVSSVSPKKNTTDQIINAFKSFEQEGEDGVRNVQLKYVDTPGLMHNKTGFLSKGWKVLGDIDFSLLVIDSSKKMDDLLQQSIKRLQKHRSYENFMKALVLNKIDLVDNKRKFHGLIAEIQKHGKFDKIFYTSALTGYGVKEIESYLVGMAKKGEWQFPREATTDSTQHQVIEEMFKEALFHRTYDQVPYHTLFQCQSIAQKTDGTHFVQFRVAVDSQNLQRMIIGKQGRNINWIRNYFRASYAKHFGVEVQVHARVVVRKNNLMRGVEELEASFQEQQTTDMMKLMREELQKQGKMIK